jgi:hypothetical protein
MSSLPPTQTIPVPIAGSELHELHSRVVGQNYYIKVRLPEKYYETTQPYPALYLLDGDHAFATATDIVRGLIYGHYAPDLIIVSPAYGSTDGPQAGGTNMRSRDLVPFPSDWSSFPPGGAAFLAFIEQELMPFVAAHYRVDPSDRTLAGFSLGAIFALYALFQKPGLFHRIVAADGFDARILDLEEAWSRAHSTLPVKLFVASCGFDMSVFAHKVVEQGYSGLTIEHIQLSAAGHFAAAAEGLTKGLVSVFRP